MMNQFRLGEVPAQIHHLHCSVVIAVVVIEDLVYYFVFSRLHHFRLHSARNVMCSLSCFIRMTKALEVRIT